MANDYGLKCPKCGQDSRFHIAALHTISINDEDIDHDDSLVWDDDDTITCRKCEHSGTVKSFSEAMQSDVAATEAENG